MNKIKIATWNVNSLRVRLPHVVAWLESEKPDVLAMQEIKSTNADFPLDAFREVGYHVVVSGQKSYNGVAIASREPVDNIAYDFSSLEDQQRRVLAVTYNNIRIINLYIPNGETITSEKYTYKLNWLNHLDGFLDEQLKTHPKTIVLGDFNIAPEEIDVHDPKRWTGKVIFTEQERNAFQRMLSKGFKDCFRMLWPEEQLYSWWDYRLMAFQRDWGLRIDHILASDAIAENCQECYIDKNPRALERPSDHAPVVAEFSALA